MTVIASGAISAERPIHVPFAVAARFSSAIVRLLFVALMLLPVYGALRIDASLAARLAIAGLFCITLVRPEDGLLICAAFVPVAAAAGGVLGFPTSLREPFVLAFLAAWLLRGTVRAGAPVDSATRRLVVPALVFGGIGLASVLVQLSVQQAFAGYPWPFAGRVIAQLAGSYMLGDAYQGLAPGALLLESVGLFVATVTLCHRQPSLARRLLAMSVVGAAGAAALAVYRLAEIGLRDAAFLHAILVQPRNIRISLPFADVNAAGSYLSMMVFAAGGLAVAGRGRRWPWAVVTALIAVALWLTGSRMAWAAVVLSGVLAVAWVLPRSRRAQLMAVVLVAVCLVFVVVSSILPSGRGTPGEEISRGVVIRLALGRAGLQMTRAHPILGVGIGRFMPESARYLDPEFAREFYPRENAHNNFLQILAELGCVGLAAFLWFLAAVGRHISRSGRLREDLLLAGTASGILAFLLSCLAGHPLLVPEIALAFSLVLAVAAGLASARETGVPDCGPVAPDPAPARRRAFRGRWVLAAVVVCLAVSVPVRAHRLLETETDLRRAAIGFSDWTTDSSGVRYRSMTGRAQFYVPDSTCWLRFGVRVAPDDPGSTTEVDLRVDGNVADRGRASSHAWTQFKLVFYPRSKPGFKRIELRTTDGSNVRLLVGAPALSDCR